MTTHTSDQATSFESIGDIRPGVLEVECSSEAHVSTHASPRTCTDPTRPQDILRTFAWDE